MFARPAALVGRSGLAALIATDNPNFAACNGPAGQVDVEIRGVRTRCGLLMQPNLFDLSYSFPVNPIDTGSCIFRCFHHILVGMTQIAENAWHRQEYN